MEFRTPQGQRRYDDLVDAAAEVVVGLDFDGVLSPIVDDPAAAVIHPDGPDVLADLAGVVRTVAVITGRPARQAVQLGGLESVAAALPAGAQLEVFGQYGNERWDSASGEFRSPPAPAGLAGFADELPDLLAAAGAPAAFVEDKRLAIAVHTRRLPDPAGAFDRLLPVLSEAAGRHGLGVEPGRLVVEVRAPGSDKGRAVRRLCAEHEAGGIMFAGDDLGDLEAFNAVADLRRAGLRGLLVCSGSREQRALVELSDLVVDGPAGVLDLLRRFTAAARGRRRGPRE